MVNPSESPLTEIEQELILFFVSAAQSFGLPKSYGEIYGLYFASEAPLALDHVMDKLQISKGSASQGIKFLREINALLPAYIPGDRRDYYQAETSLRRIADGFIKERIRPQIRDGAQRLKAVKGEAKTPHLNKQLKTLESWSKKGELVLPFVSKFLETKESPKIL